MGRRIWLALAVAAIAMAAVLASAQAATKEKRSPKVTRGIDYLHAHQVSTGGINSNAGSTVWTILGIVANGERTGSSAWTIGGKNPFTYLQSISHKTAASSGDDPNPPVYYARTIMAYEAVGKGSIYSAGSAGTDLLAQLESYQDLDESHTDTYGSFSMSSSNRNEESVRTTAWAILAMHSIGSLDSDSQEHFDAAVTWLEGQAKSSGGFPMQMGDGQSANVTDTALATQALLAGGIQVGDDIIQNAVAGSDSYLHDVQLSKGGFPASGHEGPDSRATAYAITAIRACGQGPSGDAWSKSRNATDGDTPVAALKRLQTTSGAYPQYAGHITSPVPDTSLALVALSGVNFKSYPAGIPSAVTAFRFRPRLITMAPANNAKSTSGIVLIRATYSDWPGGTGINAKKIRLYVDNADRTKSAAVGSYGLHLQLRNVANGSHTVKLVLVDKAGNLRTVTRTFTVSVPVPSGGTSGSTSTGGTGSVIRPSSTYVTPHGSTTLYPTPTATPTTSSSAYPYSSASPYPSASASPSPSSSAVPVTGAGTSAGGGTGGYLGAILLTLLPLGALLSYYVIHRRTEALAAASSGKTLAGGGSGWDHVKDIASRSKDIIKPAGS